MTEALVRPSDGKIVRVTGKVARLLRAQGWRGADEQARTPSAAAEFVPDATAREVLAWVGDIPARARAAIEAEQRRDHPRSTLLANLRKLM